MSNPSEGSHADTNGHGASMESSVVIPPAGDAEELHLPPEFFVLPRLNAGFQIPYYLLSTEQARALRPPAVIKTWEQRLGELDEKQRKSYTTFRAAVEAAEWFNPEKNTTWETLRYLVARSYDPAKAMTMLGNSVKWRKETGADEWQCEGCLRNPNEHMSQFVGWDQEHRPVLFMSMRWGPERKNPLRHMVCMFNHLITLMPEGVEKWVCMTDFETYSHLRDGKPSMGLSVIRTIQDHYPERLGKMICINPPTMFWVLYKLFYPVIDPVTRTKVEFLYTDDKPSVYDRFPELFPELLCHYLYDSYHRSRHNLPARPRVWHPRAEGYPTTFEGRKLELKEFKAAEKDAKKAEKEAMKDAKKAAKKADKETPKHGDKHTNSTKGEHAAVAQS